MPIWDGIENNRFSGGHSTGCRGARKSVGVWEIPPLALDNTLVLQVVVIVVVVYDRTHDPIQCWSKKQLQQQDQQKQRKRGQYKQSTYTQNRAERITHKCQDHFTEVELNTNTKRQTANSK